MWKFESRDKTPTQVAELFLLEAFDRPRVILGGKVAGRWVGQRFEGEFGLVDGNRTYRIECEPGGLWTVRPE